MKYLFSFIIVVLFTACGGGSSGNTTTNNTPKNVIKDKNITDTFYEQQWYLHYDKKFYSDNGIDVNASINAGNILKEYDGKGVKIAVIDDGLDVDHEDLKNAITSTYNISTNSTNVTQTSSDDFHGTAVTGIIGARANKIGIKGIASGAKIIFLKYKQSMSDSEIIELFEKAAKLGADIINNSWGTYDASQAVKDEINHLSKDGRDGKGIIIVFACGNDDKDMGNDESNIPAVISVGATNKNNLISYYSNHGDNLDIVAPGGGVLGITTLDPMTYRYGVSTENPNYLLYDDSSAFMGTSASAPIVSGIIALMLEKDFTLTKDEIENILKNTADKIGHIPYKDGKNNNYYGYGKVDLQNIMSVVK